MKNKLIAILLCITLMFYLVVIPVSVKGNPEKSSLKVQAIEKLKSLSNGKLKLREKNGQLFISGILSKKETPGDAAAIKFLEENKAILGIENISNELKIIASSKDENGHTLIKYAQLIDGLKVNGNILNVHFDKNGIISCINGNLEKNKSITTLGNKFISENDAIEAAKKEVTYKKLRNNLKAEKLILNKDGKNYEVYKVNISYMEPTIGNYDIYVEVHSGEVIQKENNIRYEGSVTGSGIDVLGVTRPLNLYQHDIYYQMKDLIKTSTSGIFTYDMENGTTTGSLTSNTINSFTGEDYKSSVSAHYNAGKVIDFYKNLFNRNSLDGMGMEIRSFTHYGTNYNNAFWDGYEMVYGDGDGIEYTYLSGDLDVVGHEMSHGVISNTADLYYHNQSGALNESIADVFGVLIQTYDKYNVNNGGSWIFNSSDWVIGDDIYTPNIPGDALRSLSSPTLYAQPDNMINYKYFSDDEYGDYGGVHINAGITNKAAYLIAKSIGMEKTARIYYRALVNYIGMYTDFQGAEDCLEQAATDLYGTSSPEVLAITDSFVSVGIAEVIADDPYEPNDSIETAYTIDSGVKYQSYIFKNTDQDYYEFNAASSGSFKIGLSDLPYDYDISLYDSNNTLIGYSSNSGTLPENINFTAASGSTYYIKVYSYGNYSTVQKYSLLLTKNVSGVNLDKTTVTIRAGETISLTATVNPDDATNKNVIWSSSNPLAAEVDNTGKVTAAGKGEAAITVKTEDGGYAASCTLTVLSNEKPVISGAIDKTIKVGDNFDAKAGVTAIDAEDGNLTSKIAVTGSVNTFALGKYTVTYTVTDSDGNKISISITISIVSRNIQVVSLIGSSRYDTAVKLSQSQFVASDTVIIVNGAAMADGLGATPLAAYKKAPLLLTDFKALPATTINEIKRLKAKNAIIVGGTGVVSDNVKSQLQNLGLAVTRIFGSNRYTTSLAVAKYIDNNCYDVSSIVIANGYGEADALSIASAAGRDNMPIILVEKYNVPTVVYDWLKSENVENAYIIGGIGVISDNVLNKIDGITTADVGKNRLGGQNRFETNSIVVNKFYGSVINKTYIAKGYLLIDALAAGPVAAINGAPVVLSGNDLSPEQKSILTKRYGDTIIRTGGGISDTAVNSLKNCLQ